MGPWSELLDTDLIEKLLDTEDRSLDMLEKSSIEELLLKGLLDLDSKVLALPADAGRVIRRGDCISHVIPSQMIRSS